MTDVSVLTPSFSYGRFIADSVESVIRQDGMHVQHIVQDGGSEDETIDVLRSFGDRIEWTSERDRGQSDALNKALAKATGRWVAWLNADEFYLPGGLQRLVDVGERSGADVVYGDAIAADRDGRMQALRPQHPFSPSILRLYGPYLDSVAVVVRRSMLGELPWDTTLKVVMDWDLYLRLLSKGASFRYAAYPVGAFRQHGEQVSRRVRSPETRTVRERYGIPGTRSYRRGAVVLHRIRKLVAGSYGRQLRARSFHGQDLRWFRDPMGTEALGAVLHRCYGLPSSTQE